MRRQNNKKVQNIDALISEISYKLIEKILDSENKTKLKNLIDKSLGVLSNNGVYAYYVYIISQKSKEAEEIFLDIFEDIFKMINSNFDKRKKQEYFQQISEDIYKLLFLKQLLEKTLIYARYHAKAMGD